MGASGDLAPLSHLALGLMGEGKMWSPKSGWADAKYVRSQLQNNTLPNTIGSESLLRSIKVAESNRITCLLFDDH